MPLVSVIIAVRDGAEFVETALQSVAKQTVASVEAIVVDDGSRDGTSEIVAAQAESDPSIRLLELTENLGPGAARSRGLAEARGDWIAVLDADDAMAPERLERLIDYAERQGFDAIADNLALVDPGNGEIVGKAFPVATDDCIEITPELFLKNTRPGAKVNLGWMQPIVRRAFLQDHGILWPDIRHGEDMVFTMRLLMSGARFGLIGSPYYRYTQRRGALTGKTSAASRTTRSITDQVRAVEIVLAEGGDALTPNAKARLGFMKDEIAATARALDARDAVDRGKYGDALHAVVGLTAYSRAFLRCLYSRFVLGHRITV